MRFPARDKTTTGRSRVANQIALDPKVDGDREVAQLKTRISPGLKRRLGEKALSTGVPLAHVVRLALDLGLDSLETEET